jgi:uncharacterized protein YqjF (DUF2071 family)
MSVGYPDIDRITPTRLPSGRLVMYHRWADLLFLHWPVPVDVLRPLFPAGLEIDTFEGIAYIGLVPFTMTGLRPWWSPPVPGLSSFHEVNVRTYVHNKGRDPGVWFFSLDAAQSIAVQIARTFWNLPYYRARMTLEHEPDGSIVYHSERLWPGPLPGVCKAKYRPEGPPTAARPGTLEHFLIERYVLYANSPSGLRLGRVHHSPYPIQSARLDRLEEDLIAANGIERPNSEPIIHYASEVQVRVFGLERVSRE